MHEVLATKYPEYNKASLPTEDDIDTSKLGDGGSFMADSCSTAQKLHRILIEKIPGTYGYDCMRHLHNVWIGAMEKNSQRIFT